MSFLGCHSYSVFWETLRIYHKLCSGQPQYNRIPFGLCHPFHLPTNLPLLYAPLELVVPPMSKSTKPCWAPPYMIPSPSQSTSLLSLCLAYTFNPLLPPLPLPAASLYPLQSGGEHRLLPILLPSMSSPLAHPPCHRSLFLEQRSDHSTPLNPHYPQIKCTLCTIWTLLPPPSSLPLPTPPYHLTTGKSQSLSSVPRTGPLHTSICSSSSPRSLECRLMAWPITISTTFCWCLSCLPMCSLNLKVSFSHGHILKLTQQAKPNNYFQSSWHSWSRGRI